MRFPTLLVLLFVSLSFPGWAESNVALSKTLSSPRGVSTTRDRPPSTSAENIFNLTDFGAVGDGATDDGPALQNALDALGESGGGTLLVPAGRFAILTPVQKDFTGLASDISILGVESLTPVPPPTATGAELSAGLNLVSEFAPRTGEQGISLNITGLASFLIKDITFIGTPGVDTDASITLALNNIQEATIRHCEFYGLRSLVAGGAIVLATRSKLNIEQSAFLGSACNSGVNASVVQNVGWKGLIVMDSLFIDYGQRPELYGKFDSVAPFSWINIGNAAAVESDSPRREVVIRNVFIDEGALIGLSSLPQLDPPQSAPIDLFYVSGLYANVSNLNASGNHLLGLNHVLIEKSHYGWSHNADSAINLLSVGNAILDQVECEASANRIRADVTTGKLTVINSVYTYLDSQSPATSVLNTIPEDDPVQYVRRQFSETIGRDPDPAAHFYWSDQILGCGDNSQCIADRKAALSYYLAAGPQEKFALFGRVIDEGGAGLAAVTITLTGSQNLTVETDADGRYKFSNLPTSGIYAVTPTRPHFTIDPFSSEIVTPAGDQTRNAVATFNHHDVRGQVADDAGQPLSDVSVTLSGSQTTTTTTDANGQYAFDDLAAGGNYTVTPRKTSYSFSSPSRTFNDLDASQTVNFTGTFITYSIRGRLTDLNNGPLAGVTVILSGAEQRTLTTNSLGDFDFTGLPADCNYTVTPALIGISFSPSSKTYDSLAADDYQAYVGIYAAHSISGRVTQPGGIAVSGATVSLTGYSTATSTTDANGNFEFSELPHGAGYTITVSKADYSFNPPSQTFDSLFSDQTANFDAGPSGTLEFSATSYTISESARRITVTVTRTGNSVGSAEVVYSGIDDSADQRSDVIPIIGRLTFAPGETSKTFIVFVTDDSYVEGDEALTLELSDPIGAGLGISSATLTITDNDSAPSAANPIDGVQFFVREQYRDFLNRPADDAGLAFWSNEISACGTDAACIADRRTNVSAAFFLSIEFQQTGFLVYRLYQASFGRPPEHLDEFLLDTRTIGTGVVVNAPGWEQLLETNKTALIEDFVARPQFSETYPVDLTPAEFVNQLNATAGQPLSTDDINAAVAEFAGAPTSEAVAARASVLRRVAENSTFAQRQTNPAFVLMQYFGYLQRNPSDAPDDNLDGYNFWLNKLNEFGGDFRRAEMVKSFLVSAEYRARFGTP